MKNAICITIFIALTAVIFVQNQDIIALSEQLRAQQKDITEIQSDITAGYVRSLLALKMTMANKGSIQAIQRKKTVRVTAYSPREDETDNTPFTTASNRKVRHGIVAVSRDLFDQGWVFGRKIYIKQMGIFTIDDLMAESKRNQIDIFMFDTERALHFGKRTMEVHLLVSESSSCPENEIVSHRTNSMYSMK
ncbi:3D domain-containing protein [Desulfovibrio mangrovi]|uniref:3D domain-containing protein n=1 Tax=Desulfovibrio mangrovi TaxID=2976983 RepID=UPI002245C8D2|nr:3D domain-containing protein [Desulfovibrio mangrovi]UZP68070.1 3D domain-containing protein [Desulfovibrio mangrovi]